MTMNCFFCQKQCKNDNSLKQHEIRCKLNPNKIEVKPSFGMRGKKGKNQFTKADELGVSRPEVSEKTRQLLSESSKKYVWLEERKEDHSRVMKEVVKKNPYSYTSSNRGRTKQIEFDGIKFQGSWELIFYNYCKSNQIPVERCVESFPYTWEGERSYFPDFYLPDRDLYIEIKGYETERDRRKWEAFPRPLKVLKQSDITAIKKGTYEL
jgi:hypothetical protein